MWILNYRVTINEQQIGSGQRHTMSAEEAHAWINQQNESADAVYTILELIPLLKWY